MDITIDQQVALDEALVPHASRLRIGKSNFRLRSDLKSKELNLQVVYDVLKLTPFYKLETGTFTSIFKCPALKQLAIKRWDEYGFIIRPCLVGVTCKSVRIIL
nr:hypothetical protein [Tanacetum cinerariifolium]